jgi:nucleoid DNA-binding protein
VDISAVIRELLFSHDCVIVPGFGGFIGNYAPARINRESNTLFPPQKQISFNRNLNHNDGLLIGRISEAAALNYGDARDLVGKFAEDLKKKLSRGEKVRLDHIGTFVNNHEGNAQFEPDRNANYHLNSYGLQSFQFMPLESFTSGKRIIKRDGLEAVSPSSIRKYLWRAAVIIPVLGVLTAMPFATGLFKNKTQQTSMTPLISVESGAGNRETLSAGADSSTKQLNETSAENNNLNEVDPLVISVNEPEKREVFHVITGSFVSEANAGALMKKLTVEGYQPELLGGPNGFFRVSAAKCSDLETAVQKKKILGKQYSGTWITRSR